MTFDWSLVQDAAYQLGLSHRGTGDSAEAQAAVKAHLDGLEDHLTKGDASARVTGADVRAAGETFRKAYLQGLEGNALAEAEERGLGNPDANVPAVPATHLEAAHANETKGRFFTRIFSRIKEFAAKLKLTERQTHEATSSREQTPDAEPGQPRKAPPGAGVFKLEDGQFSALGKQSGAEQKRVAASNTGGPPVGQPTVPSAQEQATQSLSSISSNAQASSLNKSTMSVSPKIFQERRMPAPMPLGRTGST